MRSATKYVNRERVGTKSLHVCASLLSGNGKQFPLRPAYATMFNDCQGLTLRRAILDLRTDVFAHGQLYTALFRARNRRDIQALFSHTHK
ncbi:uncharacterized protein BJ212DRAFT_1283206 [Suillus subaureus]|uniref:Uncharacterized protein n=1 Tax=Suillus subaureus TaxID=48587 RepID=A0A9P7DXZ0_9AGAM|nr:uncharacterized protein BJ212DRAFT_1283206 [Suillus subaureus]KAG1805850.1 hypothetical protein BJ212DRAFT_1283206 [Suillus subaureus]